MAISTSLTEHQQLPGEIEGRYRYGKKQWDVANEFVRLNKNVVKLMIIYTNTLIHINTHLGVMFITR